MMRMPVPPGSSRWGEDGLGRSFPLASPTGGKTMAVYRSSHKQYVLQ